MESEELRLTSSFCEMGAEAPCPFLMSTPCEDLNTKMPHFTQRYQWILSHNNFPYRINSLKFYRICMATIRSFQKSRTGHPHTWIIRK